MAKWNVRIYSIMCFAYVSNIQEIDTCKLLSVLIVQFRFIGL